jgi:elongation factor Ts
MSQIVTTEQVKELRTKTGISVMQCRRALEEAEGDMDKAVAILKKTSADIALKKADRVAGDGAVAVRTDGKKSVLVALRSETDFVAKNQDFLDLLGRLADLALKEGLSKMKASSIELINPIIQKTGEKIELGDVYEIEGEIIGSYVHNNKAAVIVSLSGGNPGLAKDVAMHVAAMKPEYISAEEIDEDTKRIMREVFEKEVSETGKPEDIKKKMLEGKMSTYFKEKTLLDQPFIKNPEETVGELLKKNGAKIKEIKRSSI